MHFNGLTDKQVEESRKKYGSNVIPDSEPTTFWVEFKETFKDPMIRILLAVALLMVVMCLFGYADGCVLFREVEIDEDADVRDSIIMQGCKIGAHAKLRYVILDKNVTIKPGTQLLGSPDHPLVINKGAVI